MHWPAASRVVGAWLSSCVWVVSRCLGCGRMSAQGLESALECGVEEVAVFAAASDAFSQKNINCSVMDSFERFKPVLAAAKDAGVRVRGYVQLCS